MLCKTHNDIDSRMKARTIKYNSRAGFYYYFFLNQVVRFLFCAGFVWLRKPVIKRPLASIKDIFYQPLLCIIFLQVLIALCLSICLCQSARLSIYLSLSLYHVFTMQCPRVFTVSTSCCFFYSRRLYSVVDRLFSVS